MRDTRLIRFPGGDDHGGGQRRPDCFGPWMAGEWAPAD